MRSIELFAYITATVISAAAFIYGALRLFGDKIPLYFKIIVCSAGCYAIEELSSLVTALCGGFESSFTVNSLGTFGCFFFLLSASYGQLDGVVDDGGTDCIRARKIAFIAPAVLALILIYCTYKLTIALSMIIAPVIFMSVYIPMLIASYYNLKHLIIKKDSFGFLKTIRAYNIWALAFYVLHTGYMLSAAFGLWKINFLFDIAIAVVLFGIIISVVKGAKIWKTLI